MGNNFLKFFIFSCLAVVVLVPLSLWALSSVFEKKVGDLVVKELNKQLTVPVKWKDFDLSLIRSFPSASLTLNSVQIEGKDKVVMLDVDYFTVKVGWTDLFSNSLQIETLEIKGGDVLVEKDQSGKFNWDIVKSSGTTASESEGKAVDIVLRNTLLEDIELTYRDRVAKQDAYILLESLAFEGDFLEDEFDLGAKTKMLVYYFNGDGVKYLSNNRLALDANVFVDSKSKVYDVKESSFSIDDNAFEIDGIVDVLGNGVLDIDLSFDALKGDIQSLITLVPGNVSPELKKIRSKGEFYFAAYVKGKYSKTLEPEFDLVLRLKDGELYHEDLSEELKRANIDLSINNRSGKRKRGLLQIKEFSGVFGKEPFEAKLMVDDFKQPYIDFFADGAVPMNAVYKLFGKQFEGGSGRALVNELGLKGFYKDMVSPSRISRVDLLGDVELDDIILDISGEDLILDRARIQLKDNGLKIEDLDFEAPGTKLLFNASCQNLIPVLFADSVNTHRAELTFNADMKAEAIDFDELIALFETEVDSTEVGVEVYDSVHVAANKKRERITDFLDGKVSVSVAEYNWNKIEGTDFIGNLVFANNRLLVKEIKTKALGGTYDLSGIVFFEEEPYLEAHLKCIDIDGTDFFYQCDNFGQDMLTDKMISGLLNVDVTANVFWDAKGEMLEDKLYANVDWSLKDGRLKDFTLLQESLKGIVKKKDLEDVRFKNISNTIEVKKSNIIIPSMFIHSNIMNLQLAGLHTFDQHIDYKMKVNVGQLISDKFRNFDEERKPKKAKNGWFNVYCNVKGHIDDFKVKIGKKGVKDYLEGASQVLIEKAESSDEEVTQVQRNVLDKIMEDKPLEREEVLSDEGIPETVEEVDDEPEYLPGF